MKGALVTVITNDTTHRTESRVHPIRLERAKKSYATRFVAERLDAGTEGYHVLAGLDVVPRPGDVVVAKVERIGQLPRLESPHSRRQALFVGDEIVVAYANRYAPDQILAEVPAHVGPCHLVAAGGLAGTVLTSHGAIGKPTQLRPVGLLADAAGRLNLRRFAPRRVDPTAPMRVAPHVVVILGTSMNSGKSMVAACLVKGLVSAGLRVAAGKATGTGAGGDPWLFQDAGAEQVLDFTDFGYASTFKVGIPELSLLLRSLVGVLAASDPEVIVVEIADGVYQDETRGLLQDPVLRGLANTVLFTANDALGATAGVAFLRQAGLAPAAVSGILTASPLASGEAAAVLDIPVIGTYELADAAAASSILAPLAL